MDIGKVWFRGKVWILYDSRLIQFLVLVLGVTVNPNPCTAKPEIAGRHGGHVKCGNVQGGICCFSGTKSKWLVSTNSISRCGTVAVINLLNC